MSDLSDHRALTGYLEVEKGKSDERGYRVKIEGLFGLGAGFVLIFRGLLIGDEVNSM